MTAEAAVRRRPAHCRPAAKKAEDADRALAEAVVRAACEVTGCPPEDALDGPPSVPELLLVRTAAAVALIDVGWSIEWAAECCGVTRKNLERTTGIAERVRRYAPAVVAAASAVAVRGASTRPSARDVAERSALEQAVRHGHPDWAADVLDAGGTMRHRSRSPRGAIMRRARAGVAAEMRSLGYTGREIAAGMGFAPSTVAAWLAESC